jgi:hypothetical protein
MKPTSFLFLSLPLVACGGSSPLQAKQGGTGGGPGQPDASSSTGGVYSTNQGTGGSAGTGGSPDAGCTGDLQVVSAALGMNCPATFCEAEPMVSSCTSLPPGVTRMSASSSGFGSETVKIEFSGTRGKGCIYSSTQLAGAVAWDDVASFCNGTSTTIAGGTGPSYTGDWAGTLPKVCDRTSLKGTGGAGGAGNDAGTIPPALCYTNYGCYPCCPTTPPDCSVEPDGYPGYVCAGSGYYCVWQCRSGKWQWAC